MYFLHLIGASNDLATVTMTFVPNTCKITESKTEKSGQRDFRYFGLVSEAVGIFLIGWKMADEIDFENRHFWQFKSHVTLTLTSDDLESHIVVDVSSTLTNTTIWFVAAMSMIVDVRTDGQTFLPGLLGHLSGDDLMNQITIQNANCHYWNAYITY